MKLKALFFFSVLSCSLYAEAPEESVPEKKPVLGQQQYEQYCSVCHRDGLMGAPKFRDTEDWNPRLAEKKLEGLVNSAINGLNAMPPKGTCYECSDEDIKDAVDYMVPKS